MSYCDKLRQRAVTSCDGLLRQNTGRRWRFHKDAIDQWGKHGLGNAPRESEDSAE